MLLRRNQFIAVIWIACLAMLMSALAPSVSHILAAGDGGDATLPCHAAAVSTHGHPARASLASMFVDCAYCSMQADLPLLPPLPAPGDTLSTVLRFAPLLIVHIPAPAFAWLGIQPRAPPTH